MTSARDDHTMQSKKRRLVRGEIWAAAIALFHAEGFDHVTVDQIAEQAGVSRRTFFRYFSSKEDVLGSMMKNFATELGASIEADRKSATPYEAAKLAVRQVMIPAAHSEATRQVMSIWKQSATARNAQVMERPFMEEELAKSFAKRSGRRRGPRVEDKVLAVLTLSATSLAVEIWAETHKRSMAEIIDEVFAAIGQVSQSRPR